MVSGQDMETGVLDSTVNKDVQEIKTISNEK